jgi:hypothetical protein
MKEKIIRKPLKPIRCRNKPSDEETGIITHWQKMLKENPPKDDKIG